MRLVKILLAPCFTLAITPSLALAQGSSGPIGPERTLAGLLNQLRDATDHDDVSRVIEAIGDHGDAAVPGLIDLLEHEGPFRVTHTYAARALVELGEAGVPALIETLAPIETSDVSKPTAIRARIPPILAKVQKPEREIIRALIRAFEFDENVGVRNAAAKALGEFGPKAPGAVNVLSKALRNYNESDPLADVHYEATVALAQIGAPAVAELTSLLDHEHFTIRYEVADALGNIGEEARSAVSKLIRLMQNKSENENVRRSATLALGKIGEPLDEIVDALVGQLKDKIDETRSHAIESLGVLGPAAAEAVPALRKEVACLDCGYGGYDRLRAAESLGKIGWPAKDAIPEILDLLAQEQSFDEVVSFPGHGTCARTLQQIAESLHDKIISEQGDDLSVAEIKMAVENLRDAEDVLATVPHDGPFGVNHEEVAKSVRRCREALQSELSSRPLAIAQEFFAKYPWAKWIVASLGYLSFCLTMSFALLWGRPAWILSINDALARVSDVQLPSALGGYKLPSRHALVIGFFHYQPRVLDAWVARHVNSVRESFAATPLVREREVHIPMPVIYDGKTVPDLSAPQLRSLFSQRFACLLLHGEGGSGKTSLACQISKWAMSNEPNERLCRHRMLPVLVDQELPENVPEDQALVEAIRGRLRVLIGQPEPIPHELVMHLLRKRRLLVFIDHYSEMSEAARTRIKPGSAEFAPAAMVITSRLDESLDGVPRNTIQPLRVDGNRLSSFIEAYLIHRDKRQLFDDTEFFDACRQLSQIVGQRNITVLLAKLYTDQLISTKEQEGQGDLPSNIPEMMLSYVNELNRNSSDSEPNNRTIHVALKVIAWECLRETLHPTAVDRDSVMSALLIDESSNLEEVLAFLEDRLRLIETTGAGEDRIRFVLDPLAEYMAAIYAVESFGTDSSEWSGFLERATKTAGAPDTIRGFILALRDCVSLDEVAVPASVKGALDEILNDQRSE